jgi:hypothetical protein
MVTVAVEGAARVGSRFAFCLFVSEIWEPNVPSKQADE